MSKFFDLASHWLKLTIMLAVAVLLSGACVGMWQGYTVARHERRSFDALVRELVLTTKEARQASSDERQYLKSLNTQITGTLTNVNGVLLSARRTLDTTNDSVAAVKPVLQETQRSVAQLQPLIVETQKTVAGVQPAEEQLTKAATTLNALASNPDIPVILTETKGLLNESQGAAAELHGMASDGHRVTNHYANMIVAPKRWFSKVWSAVRTVTTGYSIYKVFTL